MKLYCISVTVQREVSRRDEEVPLGRLTPSAVIITTETAHVCTETFAYNLGDVLRRARASAKEAWPKDEGWGEPQVFAKEIPIPAKVATRVFQSGWGAIG